MKKQNRSQDSNVSKRGGAPSKRKTWFFRLLSLVLVPILFLGGIEIVLRCAGYGYSPKAIIKYKLADKEVYSHNLKFAWRFFPPTIARTFDGFVFNVQKKPNTYRIFVLGSSAAAGVPAPAYSFGHILEVMLDRLYPDIDFEVPVIAMPAINSYAVLEMAKDCAGYQPDLFIVYMGNNEVVGPYGPGTVFTPLSPSLSLIRANIALKSTRIGQFLEQAVQGAFRSSGNQKGWGGMEMFVDKQVRYDDPLLDVAYRHFEANLKDICRVGLDAGASVIVSNVPSNLRDCPPFSSAHKTGLTETDTQRWQELYQEGVALEASGQFSQAIEKYQEAEKIDAVFADLQFRLGRCCWNTGDYPKAKEKFIEAREYDTLRFRADNRINQMIRTTVEQNPEKGLYFTDSVAAMEAAGLHEIPGADLFYEHVHMTFKGNYTLAMSLLAAIQKLLPSARPAIDISVLTEQDVARSMAYTDYERVVYLSLVYQSFLQRPPFTLQSYHEQNLAETKRQIDQQILSIEKLGPKGFLEQHRQAIQNRPDDWQIHFQYSAYLNSVMHDRIKELEVLQNVVKLCPYKMAYINMGRNLLYQSKVKEAQAVFKDLLKINFNIVEAHTELASIYRQKGEYDKEIFHLSQAISLEPEGLVTPYINLADVYVKTGKSERAMEVLKTAITRIPEENSADLHAYMAFLLNDRNDLQKALEEIQHAMRVNPAIKTNPNYDGLLKSLGVKP